MFNCLCFNGFDMKEPQNHKYVFVEFFTRFFLGCLFLISQKAEPFERVIHPDELWLYKNPRRDSYVPTNALWIFIWMVPLFIIFFANMFGKTRADAFQAILALSLAFGINGVVTNSVKLIVGRPRPDFYYRCFPEGSGDIQFPCTGNRDEVIEGRKSFPSGHSSFAFNSMVFCALYLCGKLQVFSQKGRGHSWRLLIGLFPLFLALVVAVSRTCDYHHHWQDVLVGSLLGAAIAYLCYFQYYPPLDHPHSSIPNSVLANLPRSEGNSDYLKKSDSLENISVKWI